MAQPLYFLPGIYRAQLCPGERLARSLLAARGLGEIFDDVGQGGRQDFATCELAGRGPGDKSGTVLCYQTPSGAVPRRVGYYPAEQAWHQVDDGLWIGLDTDDAPRPEEMARRKQFSGYRPELGDGQEWLVPIIRRPDGSTELPTDMFWDAAGAVQEPIKERYRAYWDETAEVADWFFVEGASDQFDKARAFSLAVRAIGLNYRFGRAEQNLLRVVDAGTYLTVLGCTVDIIKANAVQEAQKKSSEPFPTTIITPGSTGEAETTDPAEPT